MESKRPPRGPLPCQGNNHSKPMQPSRVFHIPLVANLCPVVDAQLSWSNQHSNVHAKAPQASCWTTSANVTRRWCAGARATATKVAFWSSSSASSSACFSCGRPRACNDWLRGSTRARARQPRMPDGAGPAETNGWSSSNTLLETLQWPNPWRPCLGLERLVTELRVQHNPGSFEP